MESNLKQAIQALKEGKPVILMDDEERENEGDLVVAAENMTPETMAFVIRYTGGVVCLALAAEIADRLDLPPMVAKNTAARGTAFTVSIDAARGITTGISGPDRAVTVRQAAAEDARASDFVRPGHVFPLRAKQGGVLWRAGHTEGAVDLCRLAHLRPAAVISEMMRDDGLMMREAEVRAFATEHHIPVITIADLIAHRYKAESFIRLEAQTVMTTEYGPWEVRVYRDTLHDAEQVALIKGKVDREPALVRVHSACMTGDIFGSLQCDCGAQLLLALKRIAQEGKGVFLYMNQEGRGIGLVNKIRAYELQRTKRLDTVQANKNLGFKEDLREYGVGAQILADIGVSNIRLMTNNPKKIAGIQGYGLRVVEQVPIEIPPNGYNRAYLETKKRKLGHLLKLVG